MKSLLSYCLAFFIAALFIQWDSPTIKSIAMQDFGFDADSGYVLKPQAINILQQVLKKDTVDPDWETFDFISWNDYDETDTLGKYYKTPKGTIYACLSIPSTPAYIIAEITPEINLIKHETFGGSTNTCCIENLETVFRKKGDYFIVQTCGSGSSAFCSSYIYIFKDLVAQEKQDGINEYVYTGWCGGDENTSCELTSSMDVKGDTIIMHYTSTTEKLKKNGDVKRRKSEKFDIFYTKKGNEWVPSDPAKIKNYSY